MTEDELTPTEMAISMALANAPTIEAYPEDADGKPITPPPFEDAPTHVRAVVRTNVHARPSAGSVPNRPVRTNERDP